MSGPYLIAEALVPHLAALGRRDGKFHLLPTERARQTFCGRFVANRTMIPLDQWGAAGATWCHRCRTRREEVLAGEQLERTLSAT